MNKVILDFMKNIIGSTNHEHKKYLSERTEKHFNECIDALTTFEDKGELIKSELKATSEKFGSLLEDVSSHESGIRNIIPRVPYGEETPLISALDDTPYTRTSINKYHRNLKSVLKDPVGEEPETIDIAHKILPVMESMVVLNERLNKLKGLVVVKKAAVVNKKKAEVAESAKIANHADTVKAAKFLTQMMEDDKSVLVDSLKVINRKKADKMIAFAHEENGVPDGFRSKREKLSNGYIRPTPPKYLGSELLLICDKEKGFTEISSFDRTQKLNFASDEEINERIDSLSAEQAKFIIDEYLSRVTKKLGVFFGKKDPEGSMNKIEKLSMELLGNVDATLRITFNDKSKFDLHTQTVWSHNPVNAGYHMKVPTRFTNAYKPDGTKVKSPSEKRVQDELTM